MPHINQDMICKKVKEARQELTSPGIGKTKRAIALLDEIQDLLDEKPRTLLVYAGDKFNEA